MSILMWKPFLCKGYQYLGLTVQKKLLHVSLQNSSAFQPTCSFCLTSKVSTHPAESVSGTDGTNGHNITSILRPRDCLKPTILQTNLALPQKNSFMGKQDDSCVVSHSSVYSRSWPCSSSDSSHLGSNTGLTFSQFSAGCHPKRVVSAKTSRRSFHSGNTDCSRVDVSAEILTESDLTDLVQKIISEASRVDVMAKSVPQIRVEQLVLDLHNVGVSAADIHTVLTSHPQYLTSSKLIPAVDSLMSIGLQPVQVVSVLQVFEAVLNLKPKKMMEVCDTLRDARFYDRSLATIITKDPSVLLLNAKTISQRVGMLRELFTTADVITLILNSPQLLTADWSEIQVKFDYIFHEMKITQKQMVYASLFSHSLTHIKHRHVFLVRAGLFDMSKRREGEKSPNARLDQIISSTDEAFCQRFGFRVEDYRAFCKLHDKELSKVDMDSDEEN